MTMKKGIEKTYRKSNNVSRFISGKIGDGTGIKQAKEKVLDSVYHSLEGHFFGFTDPNAKVSQNQRQHLDQIHDHLCKTNPDDQDLAVLEHLVGFQVDQMAQNERTTSLSGLSLRRTVLRQPSIKLAQKNTLRSRKIWKKHSKQAHN